MRPKPKPDTYAKTGLLWVTSESPASSSSPALVLSKSLYKENLNASYNEKVLKTKKYIRNFSRSTWINTEIITPKNKYSRNGTMINHIIEDANKASSHKNDEKMNKIILIGLSEIVKINIARGAPNARKAQPKNSATVILSSETFYILKGLRINN